MKRIQRQMKAGGRGRKRAHERALKAAKRFKGRVGGWSSGAPWELWGQLKGVAGEGLGARRSERALALAIGRARFREGPALRALCDVAGRLGEGLAGAPGVGALKEIMRFALSRPSYEGYPKGRLDRWRARIARAWRARPKGRSRLKKAAKAPAEAGLLSLAQKAGFPMRGQDERGEGLERWVVTEWGSGAALGRCWSARRSAALRWWRDEGFEPDRPGAGAKNVAEAAVASGSVSALSEIEALWPEEQGGRVCGEALGRALELIKERDESQMKRDPSLGPAWPRLMAGASLMGLIAGAGASQRTRRIILAAREAASELERRPQAVRSRGGLGEFLRGVGDARLGERIERLEAMARAREERELLAKEVEPGGAGAPSRRGL